MMDGIDRATSHRSLCPEIMPHSEVYCRQQTKAVGGAATPSEK